MSEFGGDSFSAALASAIALASWPVLPLLLVCYVRQLLRIRRIRSEFSLRQFESLELDRAIELHAGLSKRITEFRDREKRPFSWRIVLHRETEAREPHADELDELEAHAQHLQTTIVRLSREPLRRLRSWMHIKSLQFAFREAIQTYFVSFALLLLIAFDFFDHSIVADEFESGVNDMLSWYPLGERCLYANAVASALAAVVLPAFYMMRWISLRRSYNLEFCVLKDLAQTGPIHSIDKTVSDDDTPLQPADHGCDCFAVLGVPESATIEEIRQAYKALIKQNHPDRVHDLSPALRKLAESQTKIINAAYQQALTSMPMH